MIPGERRSITLFGHGFTRFPQQDEPHVTATYNGTINGYAVFTIGDDEPLPEAWKGTYRLPLSARDLWDGGKA